jgi:hypothetical protein
VEEATATEVVEQLRTRRIFASINRRVGIYNVGVRVVIPDGREAIWDNDGASGLEAMVLRDGVLVGYVPQIPDSDNLDAAAITEIIANANYDLPPASQSATKPAAAATPAAQSTPAPAAPAKASWRDRFRR